MKGKTIDQFLAKENPSVVYQSVHAILFRTVHFLKSSFKHIIPFYPKTYKAGRFEQIRQQMIIIIPDVPIYMFHYSVIHYQIRGF